MQSQGAPNIQGDAFMTKDQDRSPLSLNGVDAARIPDASPIPSPTTTTGSTCPPTPRVGRSGSSIRGSARSRPARARASHGPLAGRTATEPRRRWSAFYELYDKIDPPYSPTDVPVASSGNTFKDLSLDDATLGGSNGSGSCQGLAWHDGWWLLANGLTGGPDGTTYRLHTHTDGSDQDNTTALNAFAIWATATGGTPSVYGNGAMASLRVPPRRSGLGVLPWPRLPPFTPGRRCRSTCGIRATRGPSPPVSRSCSRPAPATCPRSFTYTTSLGTTDSNASSCPACRKWDLRDDQHGWQLVVQRLRASPDDCPRRQLYAAPTPPGETEGGWWKIRYTMGGSASSYSTDLTTWKVQILSNPVHLIVP